MCSPRKTSHSGSSTQSAQHACLQNSRNSIANSKTDCGCPADAGREEGSKDRPCAIVLAVTDDEGESQVMVLPVTHSPPGEPADAVEISRPTKQRLGLDGERFLAFANRRGVARVQRSE